MPADDPGKSVGDVQTGTDGATRGTDTGFRTLECQTDTVCFAKFPELPECRRAACVNGECKQVPTDDSAACQDGDPCTVDDYCLAGTCRKGQPRQCSDNNVCTDDDCDPATGECRFLPGNAACSEQGACAVGVCKAGACATVDKLFWAPLALPSPGTATAMATFPDGSIAIAAQLDLPAPATRVVLITTDPGGGGAKAGEPLPMTRAHAIVPFEAGVLLAGEVTVSGASHDGVVVHVTKTSMPWIRRYGGAGHDRLASVAALSQGGFVAAGGTASRGNGQHDAWFIHASKTGFPLLDFTYGSSDDEHAAAIATLPGGGYALAGWQIGKGGADGLVFTIGADAGLKWLKHFGGSFDDRAHAVVGRVDGAVAVAGEIGSNSVGGTTLWIGVYSEADKLLWKLSHAGDGWARASTLHAAPFAQAGLLFGGATVTKVPGAPWQPLVGRVDALGNLAWQRTIAGLGGSGLSAVIPAKDGFVGLAEAVTGVDATFTLLRGDAFGNLKCKDSGACATKIDGCNDANPCTADLCTAAEGCKAIKLPDGSPCGGASNCSDGACK